MSHFQSLLVRSLIGACAMLLLASAGAHEFKLDALMNAFVKIEPDQADLVIRAPLYLFKSSHFPVKNIEIDVANSAPAIGRALAGLKQDIVVYEDGQPLTASKAIARLSLPSDRSFDSYDDAARHIADQPAADTQIYVDQGYVDAHLIYPIRSPKSVFSIRSTAAPELGNYLKLALRYLPLGEEGRAMVVTGDSGTVNLNPPWYSAAAGFVGLGITHILTGADHLLFLLCLVIPLSGWRQILAIVTTFTIAHSFTLLGSAFGLAPTGAWFPPFVESAIAASIVFMALENIIGIDVGRRVVIAGLFGLVHGFGFSYGLQENLQFAGTHLLVSLFAFNIGIEMGQIFVLALMLPALAFLRRYLLPGRVGMIILSALVAHVGWHWMTERWEALAKVPWPQPSAAGVATLGLWLAGVLLAAGGIAAIARRLRLAGPPLPLPQRGSAD
ncbi:MAG TPA: HupE/UreJ family protein [Casimicrobiaceae bacterium]|jgi:hypothetical protein